MRKVFAEDSTYLLMKKYFIYKTMGSDLFINHALTGMNLFYKVFGTRFTNFLVNKSAGEIFTSGESIQTLIKDIQGMEKKHIHGIGNYVVEGIPSMDAAKIAIYYRDMMESIHQLTEGSKEGNFAIKLTSMISIDIMTRLSTAQEIFIKEILKFGFQEQVNSDEIKMALTDRGISFTNEEIDLLMKMLKFEDNTTDSIS
jgi:hypothetical protein